MLDNVSANKRTTSKRKAKRRRTPKRRSPRTADEFFAMPDQWQSDWEDTLRVFSKMRSERMSLKRAAKQEGVKLDTVTAWDTHVLKKRPNRSYRITKTDSLLRVLQLPTPEGMREVAIRSSRDASTVGRYWDAVNKYRGTGDDSRLKKFNPRQITDANGEKIPLITDLKELDRLNSAGVLSFESLYARSA